MPEAEAAVNHSERARTQLDLVPSAALGAWLDRHGLGSGPTLVRSFGEGNSNITCLVSRDGFEAVLRRPPRPPYPPSAHDVIREARFLQALGGSAVPLPNVLAVCEDPAVIDAPFFLMNRVEGEVVADNLPSGYETPDRRRELGDAVIDALAAIHGVDYAARGITARAATEDFVQRQLHRFGKLFEAAPEGPWAQSTIATGDWLKANAPIANRNCLTHGDYRLGNLLIRSEGSPVAAVLDWELSTVGDPLADLGYLLAHWFEAEDPNAGALEFAPATRIADMPKRADLVERYAHITGIDTGHIGWYLTFALWRSTVIGAGVAAREATREGQPDRTAFYEGLGAWSRRAESLVGHGRMTLPG